MTDALFATGRGTTPLDPFPSLADLPRLRPVEDRVVSKPTVADDHLRSAARDLGFEEGRRAGFQQGVFEGRARGEQDARAEAAERFALLFDEVERALVAVRHRAEVDRQVLADEVADLALRVAEAVVGRAVEVGEVDGRDALARAIAAVPEGGPMVARLHPTDLAELSADDVETAGRELQLVADPTLRPGDCILDAGAARVDATLAGALERVRAVLMSEPEVAPVVDLDGEAE